MIYAPKNKPPQIVSNPVREPVNRNTALLMRKASWIEQPIPEEPNMELSRLRQENSDLKKQKFLVCAQLASTHALLQKTKKRLDDSKAEMARCIEQYEEKIKGMEGQKKLDAEKDLRKYKVIETFSNLT